jgi:hypothetical protein
MGGMTEGRVFAVKGVRPLFPRPNTARPVSAV